MAVKKQTQGKEPVGSLIGRIRQNKAVLWGVGAVLAAGLIYIGLTLMTNNKINTLLNDWDKQRTEAFVQELSLEKELDVLSEKFELTLSDENVEPGLIKQGSVDARALDKKYETLEAETDDQWKGQISAIKELQGNILFKLTGKKQRELVATLPAALEAELSTEKSRKENLAASGYFVNYFDLLDGVIAYYPAFDEQDPAKALAMSSTLQKFGDSTDLYREQEVKDVLPVSYKGFKAGATGLGQFYQLLELANKPDASQADYYKAVDLSNQSQKNVTTFVNSWEESMKEVLVFVSSDITKTDGRVYQFITQYKGGTLATVKPSFNVTRELVLAIQSGSDEYSNSTANAPLNPEDLPSLISTLKSRNITTWLPSNPEGMSLVKRDGNAILKFKLNGQDQEKVLFSVDVDAPTNQTT